MLGFTIRTLSLRRMTSRSAIEIRETQTRRLTRLVRHAVEHSLFWREKYRGINPDFFDLRDLPPTNKTELMAHFDEAVTDRSIRRADLEGFLDEPANEGRWFLGKYAASHTSGSQGQPMLMVQPRRAVELFFGLQMTRGNGRKPTNVEALKRFVTPARLAVVTLKRGFYPSASMFQYMPAPARRFVKLLWLSQTDPDAAAKLNAFRPTALTAYAGVLEMLAQEAETGRLRIYPELQQVVNNSEALTDKAKARVEAAFGVHVMNNYATGECAFLSNGCTTDDGAHLNGDWLVLEVVDENNNPVRPGEPGKKVLITNLVNTVQPFIRYEIGDVVTMADRPCRCGSTMPRVERIEGRSADLFWIKDGDGYRQMISSVFKNAFDYTREVREWQAEQVERNRIRVRLEVLPGQALDEPHARRSLDRQLEMYGFRGLVDVSLEVVPRLEADPSTGKFRRIVSRVGAPDQELRLDPAHAHAPMGHAAGVRQPR